MTVATLLNKVDPYRPVIYGVLAIGVAARLRAPTEQPVAITEDIIDNWLAADAAYQECAARVLRLKGWYSSPRP